MIRKSRTKEVTNQYIVTGSEHIHLHCTLPSGQIIQVTIGAGTIDVNNREFVSIATLFDKNSTVEFRQDMPQSAQLIIRMPKEVANAG